MNNKNILYPTIVVVLVALLYFVSGAFASNNNNNNNNNNDNIRICHATGSQQNPYVSITVDDDAIDGNGNSDHNRSGHQNGEDIIPPGYWDNNGRNWTPTNIAIYNNNCSAVLPTNTPVPTQIVIPTFHPTIIPTKTPTPTPTQTEDPTPSPTGGNVIDGNIYDVCIPYITQCPTLTPTIITEPTQTPTPTQVESTTTPTPTSKPTDQPAVGGAQAQSTSSSSSSSSSSPSTGGGEVLGATTLARTGVFKEMVANFSILAGTLLMGVGSLLYGKKNFA